MIGLLLGSGERMVAYTVHEPPNPAKDRLDRAEKLVFVKDGFNWFAALLAPIWLLGNRMWLVFAAYVIGMIALSLLLPALGFAPVLVALIELAVGVIIGFEADSLKRWSLERKGWQLIGTVSGRSSADCERRFFEDWLPRQDVLRLDSPMPSGSAKRRWFGDVAQARS